MLKSHARRRALVDHELERYLTDHLDPNDEKVQQLENYAKENRVPIMEPLGIDFLMQMVRLKQPNNILEIGTAIGYSALRMLEANPSARIVTIERDEIRYNEAVRNVQAWGKQQQMDLLFGDALEMENEAKLKGPYDLLFIDAAKGQYKRFFEIYSQYLTDDALIISDNVLFKGMVVSQTNEKNRLNNVAKKLRSFNDWLMELPEYKTTIVPIGDGIAITVKR
ncbi:O-methyltransferase [Aquibacillus koreensis]|nr:O-methyltransferase [Aquibacillus koreensis]MCT2537645.1 O-methyltransferase [Aquibacillus koreensis]